jgi:hypothetical protein
MRTTASWPIHFTALSPIVHGSDEKAGNMSFSRSMPFFDSNGNCHNVPVITGNSMRGKLRRIAARRLLEALDIKTMPISLYHLFFSGGAIEKGSSKIAYDVGQIAELRSLIPYVGLFGGAFFNDIFPSTLRCEFSYAVCKETEEFTDIKSEISARNLITQIFYTRKDDKHESIMVEGSDSSSQMIYEFEAIATGTRFVSGIGVERATELEVGCLADTWRIYSENPRLGGKSAIGHGKLKLEQKLEIPCGDRYEEYLKTNADAMKSWLVKFGARTNQELDFSVPRAIEIEEAQDEK